MVKNMERSKAMEKNAGQIGRPLLDLQIPAKVASATFGMG